MSFITVSRNLNADELRDWLVTNVGKEILKGAYVRKCGEGWDLGTTIDYKEIPAVLKWGITIDDEALAVFFKLRWA